MRRSLIVGGCFGVGLLLVVISYLASSARTSRESRRAPQYRFEGSRDGLRAASTGWGETWSGVLVDAGCPSRDSFALSSPPASTLAKQPPETAAAGGAATGVSVSSPLPAAERSDAESPEANDLRARNSDPACAITTSTRGFAILLPNGELKNLDEGGTTKAAAAFEGSPRGQAVMNGRLPGDKPRAVVTGVLQGDRIVVDEVYLR